MICINFCNLTIGLEVVLNLDNDPVSLCDINKRTGVLTIGQNDWALEASNGTEAPGKLHVIRSQASEFTCIIVTSFVKAYQGNKIDWYLFGSMSVFHSRSFPTTS